MYVAGDGTRKAIRLGKVDRKAAEAFEVRVERLVSATLLHAPPENETPRGPHPADGADHTRAAGHVREAFDAAPEGATLIVSGKRSNEYLRQRVKAAAARAGVDPWADLFDTLRSSCEREWALTFPQYAVSRWIGHRIAVSGAQAAHNAAPSTA